MNEEYQVKQEYIIKTDNRYSLPGDHFMANVEKYERLNCTIILCDEIIYMNDILAIKKLSKNKFEIVLKSRKFVTPDVHLFEKKISMESLNNRISKLEDTIDKMSAHLLNLMIANGALSKEYDGSFP